MSAMKTPIETVRAFSDAMEKMDFDTALELVADDLEYINSPDTRSYGPQGVRDILEPFFAPIEENEFVILREAASGSSVFLERLDRHRIPQGWFELPVTGVYDVKDERIVYWREYFDLNTVVTAMTELMGG